MNTHTSRVHMAGRPVPEGQLPLDLGTNNFLTKPQALPCPGPAPGYRLCPTPPPLA